MGASDHFLAYYIGAPRSLFSLTIWSPADQFLLIQWGPLSDQFHCLLYEAPPQISFFACYRGGHFRFFFFHKIYGGLLRSVSPLTMWGPLRLVFLLTIWGPLRSVSVHILCGGPFRSVSSHTI